MTYVPAADRYERMLYRRCGRSGLKLPAISLGLWHNFGARSPARDGPRDPPPRVRPRHHALRPRQQLRPAVRLGRGELRQRSCGTTSRPYRDELIISTKAGYDMWPGPYGDWGSRKYLLASLDQSLAPDGARLRRHLLLAPLRPRHAARGDDGRARRGRAPGQGALRRHLVVLGRAAPREAAAILRDLGTPLLIHQPSYSMLNRWIEDELLDVLGELGVGCIVFSPLAQGMLTDKYLDGIPEGSRASWPSSLSPNLLTEETLAKIRALNEIAAARGQSLAQMALAWVLRDPRVTSALIGACSVRAARGQRRRARRASTSRTTSSPRSTATRPTATSTSGPPSSDG